jgi:nitrite reductase (NADH) large subunit
MKIAVIGNSLTAIKTIEELKTQGEDVEAVFVSSENTFPYLRHQLDSLPSKKVTQNKILYRANTEYEKEKIQFIFDKKVTRINFKRGRITLDDKEQIDYDVLLLSDLVLPPFFGLKGANKTGLYNVKRLFDINALIKALPGVETIVIESDHLSGLKAALAFASLAANPPKEVILVTSRKNVLGGLLNENDAASLEVLLTQGGLRIIAQNQIAEILGDNEAKAVRLQNGKVFGCQAILTDSDLPDLRLFKESELQHNQRVVVNEKHQTNFDNVFALDSVCDTITFNDWDMSLSYPLLAQEQSKVIAAAILKKEYVQSVPIPSLVWDIEAGSEKVTFSVGSEESKMLQMQSSKQEAALNA